MGVGGAEQRLHLTEAAETEALRETHDGRRMHFALAGDVADAVDHDPVALLAHVTGDAFELARQGFVLLGDQMQQALGIDRRAGERALFVGRQIGAGHKVSFGLVDQPVAREVASSPQSARLRLILGGLRRLCCAETMHRLMKMLRRVAAGLAVCLLYTSTRLNFLL